MWYDIRSDKEDKVRDQNKSEWRLICVAECKFVSPMYCEVEQTKMSEFGVEKGIMQGLARRMGDFSSKNPNSPTVFKNWCWKLRWNGHFLQGASSEHPGI